MNVIFLDFDGVINTNYYKSDEQIEGKIKILSDICHEYDCKVVIEASAKDAIDEETLEIDKVRNHLIKTKYYLINNPYDEGLQPYHKEEVGKVLKLENDMKKYALRKMNRN